MRWLWVIIASQVPGAQQVRLWAGLILATEEVRVTFKSWVSLDFLQKLQVFVAREAEVAAELNGFLTIGSAKIAVHITQVPICEFREGAPPFSHSAFVSAFQRRPFLWHAAKPTRRGMNGSSPHRFK